LAEGVRPRNTIGFRGCCHGTYSGFNETAGDLPRNTRRFSFLRAMRVLLQ